MDQQTLSDKINALPDWARQFIHDLEARVDPAGDVRTIAELRENVEFLTAKLMQERKRSTTWCPTCGSRFRSLRARVGSLGPEFSPICNHDWHTEEESGPLRLQGKATDMIWVQDDGPEPHTIGLRLDEGDAGVVYLTREQADTVVALLEQLPGREGKHVA